MKDLFKFLLNWGGKNLSQGLKFWWKCRAGYPPLLVSRAQYTQKMLCSHIISLSLHSRHRFIQGKQQLICTYWGSNSTLLGNHTKLQWPDISWDKLEQPIGLYILRSHYNILYIPIFWRYHLHLESNKPSCKRQHERFHNTKAFCKRYIIANFICWKFSKWCEHNGSLTLSYWHTTFFQPFVKEHSQEWWFPNGETIAS